MISYNIAASSFENTIVAEYELIYDAGGDGYQSEADLEQEFIRILTEQGYEHFKIKKEKTT